MHKDQRLRRRRDFAAAYRRGRIYSDRLLVLRVIPNDSDVTRFGFVVGKAVGGAVLRNRTKRRLREAARTLVRPSGRGYDVVVNARKAAGEATSAALRASLTALAGRAGLLPADGRPEGP